MKKFLKLGCSGLIAFFIFIIAIALIFGDSSETTTEDKNADTEKEVKVDAKKEAPQEEKTDEQKEAEKADKLAADKEYYVNEVKTAIDTQMKMYDAAWNELWIPTFEGLGTTVDIYTAYDNMRALEQRYKTLYSSFPAIEGEGLSKDNQKLLKDFTDRMKNASMWRGEAAKKAQKMLDEKDYSPSRMDKMKTDIQYADSELMQAVIALTTLESTLGVERES